MPKSQIFFYACLFFIAGVFIRSVFGFDFFYVYMFLLAVIILAALSFYYKYLGLAAIFLFAFGLGLLRVWLSLPVPDWDKIYFFNGQKKEFIGVVTSEPDLRENNLKLIVQTQSLLINDSWQKTNGKVLLTTNLFPEFNYGDQLKVICDLQKPEVINGFAYDLYLSRYNIYSLCYFPKIIVLKAGRGNLFLSAIYDFKNYFVSKINRILPEPQSSFLAGILIGAKKSMPAELKDIFNKTGTTHIVAVSGYNVAIMATFLLLCAQTLGLGRKKSFWLIMSILVVFTILTGLQASIVRAAIMGGLVLVANYLGRLSKIRNTLVLAAVLMLVVNPKILVYDLGFQLSFLATLGLVYLSPILNQLFKVKKLKSKICQVVLGDYFLTTMSAIIMTQPLVLYQFGKISLIAPLANILILPFIPLAMLLGFIAALGAIIFTPLGWIIGWSVWLVLSYIIWILGYLAQLNWAYWEFPKISVWLMMGLYIMLCSIVFKFKSRFRG